MNIGCNASLAIRSGRSIFSNNRHIGTQRLHGTALEASIEHAHQYILTGIASSDWCASIGSCTVNQEVPRFVGHRAGRPSSCTVSSIRNCSMQGRIDLTVELDDGVVIGRCKRA